MPPRHDDGSLWGFAGTQGDLLGVLDGVAGGAHAVAFRTAETLACAST